MRYQHMNPAEALGVPRPRRAHMLGMHWGTFDLTDEPVDLPPARCAAVAAAGGDPARVPCARGRRNLARPRLTPLHPRLASGRPDPGKPRYNALPRVREGRRPMRGSRPIQLPLFTPAESAGGRAARPRPGDSGGAISPKKRHEQLFRRLSRLLEGRLAALDLTDNRRTILTVKPARPARPPAPLKLRLHRSFVDAPGRHPCGRWRSSPAAGTAVPSSRGGAGQDPRTLPPATAGRPPRPPPGARWCGRWARCLDLRELRDEINRTYFGGRAQGLAITWGKTPAQGRLRPRGAASRPSTWGATPTRRT